MRLIASFVLVLATALSQVAMAQEPPTRVGRLAFTQGSVALFQDPDEGWEKAYVNSPITSENSIWTNPSARAEMRVSGIALRLDESTQLDIAKLDDDELHAFVAQGSVAVRVRHFSNNDRLDFATPHARFRLYGTGRYRIDVDAERDETVLTVFTGTASMRSASGDVKVDAGRAIRVEGGAHAAFARLRAQTNAFDRWTLARDQGWTESRSLQYVSTDMTGYEDLDRYGTWAQEPEYGAVWFPRSVARDWVPYRQGHWDYVRPWGWTWIADEPWGYAPYHYGRWVYVRDRWGWYPGPRTARPAWAPALVGFVGGASFSVGISGGSTPAMGWYPLAPWERYEPWYRTNTSYVSRINVNVRDTAPRQWADRDRAEWRYANRDQGATVVRRDAFLARRPVEQNIVRVTPEALRQAPAAPATNLLPGREEFRREARTAAPAGTPMQNRPGAPATGQAPQQQAAEAPFVRPGERGGPSARPNFERRQQAPAPAPAPATAQQPAAQQPAGAPSGRPFGRDDQRTQERAARDIQQQQQQAQERAARDAQQTQQQAQERAAREALQAQERAAREAQQGQQQQQQRQVQERAAREAQQAQERAAREAQQAQERGAREAQQVQERAARDQQQQLQDRARAQEQQQRQQQQAQERAAREAQRQQEQQQQAQERAAREAQRGQPAAAPPPAGRGQPATAPPPAGREAAPAQPAAAPPPAARGQPATAPPPAGREAAPAQPAPQPAAQPAAPAQPRGRDKEKDKDKDKEKDKDKDKDKEDDDKPGKGRGR